MGKIDYSTFAFPKGRPLNKKNKKTKVSKSTYDEVMEVCKYQCALCGEKGNLELHHIYYRSEEPNKIDDPENCIMLCHPDFSKNKCHGKAHKNKKYWKPRLIKIREKLNKERAEKRA